MTEQEREAWERRHNSLHGTKTHLEKLIRRWRRELKGNVRKRRLGAWEAELADVSIQIEEHERLGRAAGFYAVDSTSKKLRIRVSDMSTEQIERRIAELAQEIARLHPKAHRALIGELSDQKSKFIRELKRRKSGTGHQTSWQRWSKTPDRVRFWRG